MKTTTLVSLRRAAPALAAACALFSGAVAQAQPTLNRIYPDGTVQFQPTNQLAFTLGSTAPSGISAASVSVTLYITNLSWVGVSTQVVTTTSGLTLTGPASLRVGTLPLTNMNVQYTAVIQAADTTGDLDSTNTFDTIIPGYTWEAEDYDYGGGKYFDNPQTNAYAGLVATLNLDAFNPSGGASDYRPVMTGADTGGDLATEVNSDTPRIQYTNPKNPQSDYDETANNLAAGLWGNYTRHYPAGKWNIYARCSATGGGASSELLQGGGREGTFLGRFLAPNTGALESFGWAPLLDTSGNLVEWVADGSAQTLTIAVVGGGYNMNFFMLMPVPTNSLAPPSVSNVSPNPALSMFSLNNQFSFTANSQPGMTTNGIVVTLNGFPPYGATYSGSSHAWNFSCPVALNRGYTATIVLTDANGTSTFTEAFSTYSTNNYTWECEDWDYNGGQFFDNPQIDKYAGLAGITQVDAYNNQGGGTGYRTNDVGNLGNEVAFDVARSQFTLSGNADYDIGWTLATLWANYTRTYPKGVYNLIARTASWGSSPAQMNVMSFQWVTAGVGTANQTLGPSLGQINAPYTANSASTYQNYTWAPLVDSLGNLVTITNSGSVATLRMNENNGSWNANFYMLVPPDTTRPLISHLYPDGSLLFQPTNTLSFVATSSQAIASNLVMLSLNGAVVPTSQLVFSGYPTNLTVSYPNLQPDANYVVSIVVNTTNNDPASANFTFATFPPTYYTFEAEDWDYNSGQFFDNPQFDAYLGQLGTAGVDATNLSLTGGAAYRVCDAGDPGTEVTGDALRAQYLPGTNDYDMGWTAAGQWTDYTRTYPTGVFNFYLRAAGNPGGTNTASLSRVTSGVGTSTQTTTPLGQFNIPNTGGWQAWTFTPLVDSNGDMVTITNSGKVSTFRFNQNAGGFNANFFMLVPAVPPAPGPTVTISWTPAGGTLLSSPTLGSSAVWTPLANAANPMTIPIGKSSLYFRVQSTAAAKLTIKSP